MYGITVPASSVGSGFDEVDAAAWRVAYAITGDRSAATAIAAAAAGRLAARQAATVTALLATTARLALVHARSARRFPMSSGGHREALWTALQALPRRDRAAIMARLHQMNR